MSERHHHVVGISICHLCLSQRTPPAPHSSLPAGRNCPSGSAGGIGMTPFSIVVSLAILDHSTRDQPEDGIGVVREEFQIAAAPAGSSARSKTDASTKRPAFPPASLLGPGCVCAPARLHPSPCDRDCTRQAPESKGAAPQAPATRIGCAPTSSAGHRTIVISIVVASAPVSGVCNRTPPSRLSFRASNTFTPPRPRPKSSAPSPLSPPSPAPPPCRPSTQHAWPPAALAPA
mmetsp:Transcript_9269/g.30683  ORF Transcript_9269/g.30683 Transcript_9269/m.30683 type:complete len:232 (+) Transcript_9269:126-821(+)